MNTRLPLLFIRGPAGEERSIELCTDLVTIGRLPEHNTLALEDDPQRLVTRKGHCQLERRADGWWVVDHSANGTLLRRGEGVVQVQQAEPLENGDTILILARLRAGDGPVYWELTLVDAEATRSVQQALYLEYDWVRARLFRTSGRAKTEITDLRPKEHVLIRYMDRRNRENGYLPVLCTYEELIEALWEDGFGRSREDVNHLVYLLRKKIEPSDEPALLQTVSGLGFRLVSRAAR